MHHLRTGLFDLCTLQKPSKTAQDHGHGRASSMVIKRSLIEHGKSRDQCVDGMEKQHELQKIVVLGVSAHSLYGYNNFMLPSRGPICSRIHLNSQHHHRAEVAVKHLEFVRCIERVFAVTSKLLATGRLLVRYAGGSWLVSMVADGKPSPHFQSMSFYPYE
ncbi:hypothetical protein BDP81DRAFT_420435 [Colletotrichum phormii]|uniref:Uncharacterized protein n=1 Tax=Colletotrichum phormii TaxID=359342 RepID=A0AAI9ZYN5_9PEZI|nr:uncharacterized protein BDP81DRAFT_420435 [Colletotrichum phormii]KAK1640636.1 hypothetical protein BDP81DRAFT_420435 [Colletotrichum phormii]